jgi:hypothetical protein
MLLFRDEEHVDRWCRQWNRPRGAILTLDSCWKLAHAWYRTRLDPDWRRPTPEEAQALFAKLGLTSEFWRLG